MGLRAAILLLWVCQRLSEAVNALQDYGASPEETMPYFPEDQSGKCSFPFYYKNGVFYDCIKFKAKHKWCSLTQTFKGYWKYCSEEDVAKCVFPFWYRRMIYWQCTEDSEASGKKWCSLTRNYNKEKLWKYCE